MFATAMQLRSASRNSCHPRPIIPTLDVHFLLNLGFFNASFLSRATSTHCAGIMVSSKTPWSPVRLSRLHKVHKAAWVIQHRVDLGIPNQKPHLRGSPLDIACIIEPVLLAWLVTRRSVSLHGRRYGESQYLNTARTRFPLYYRRRRALICDISYSTVPGRF